VIAILGGLGAAVMWASANLISSRSSRLIGAASTLAWMMLVGLAMATPLAVASGPLPPLTPALWAWAAGSGLGTVIGLFFFYRGLRIGKVGVVAALASTEGAIAAVMAIVAGERPNIPVIVMLFVITAGVATVALSSGETVEPYAKASAGHDERRAIIFGVAAALCFGLSIYSIGQLALSLPPFVALLPPRIVGVAGVWLPLALTGRLRMSRQAAPMVVVIGIAEVLGNASYIVGARESIAIAAVLASQYAAVAAVGAFVLFGERLSPSQRWGIVVIAAGIAVLTAVRG
jgi:drug/metabolite transporter (DMT)-like permease